MTKLTINLQALAQNYAYLSTKSSAHVAGVLKADAYGHGLMQVAQTLMDAGCREFFVATIAEGVKLRTICPHNIYILGGIHSGHTPDLIAHNLIPVLNSPADIAAWQGSCALHFDTGMNRLGLSAQDANNLTPAMLSHLNVTLAMSHFVSADEQDNPLTTQQSEAFAHIKNTLNLPNTKWSLCNSAGLLTGADTYDIVRPGYALYGGNPCDWLDTPLKPVASLTATILQTRSVKAGDTVGYNATHTFKRDTTIATLNLGYADGFLRSFSNKAHLYWQQTPCPILGRVSMDTLCIDIGHINAKPRAGDSIEVLGPHQSIDTLAPYGSTIGYEILTSLGNRYERSYL